MRVFPRAIYNFEGDILIRRASFESQNAYFRIVSLVNFVRGGEAAINKVRVEDIELIPLHCLWRWIVVIVMSSVILCPIIACTHC